MPTAIDPELSDIYQEVSKRGLFKSDEEMQQLGHELRARGIVVDPTQGGLVSPAPTVSDFTSHTVHDAGGAAPPALPSTVKQPSPPLNALQQILGLGGTHGTFYNSGKAAIQGLAQVPEQLLGGMGNIVAGTYGAGADSYEQHQQGQDPGTRAISDAVTNNPLTGPQTMIGHGVAAAKAGKLGEFARGVPAGIGKETVENPVGQILNVLSLVGAGEITLSAAGKGLLDHSVAMEAQAAKYAASGDAARSAIYSQAAARARTAAQGLNRTAFAIHRGTTLGPVGDVARSAAADMADRIAPGSDFAKNLRYQADFSRARAAQLRAEKATRQAANWNRVNKENPEGAINIGGMKPEPAPASTPAAQQGLLTAPPPEDLMQGAVPPPPPVSPLVPEPQPPAAWPGPQPTPTTQPMPTESPAPDLAPAPVVPGTEPQPRAEAPTTEAPTVPLWNNGNPQRLQNTSPENFFSDYQRQYGEAYKANRQMAIDAGAPITEQTGRLLFDKTVAQLRPMYDEATGLLGKQSLLDTIQGAIEHGQKTQEPVLYFNAKPNGKVDPATTRALADFLNDRLASRGDAGKSHVSFYTPDGKSVSGVYAGTYPSVFLTLLANAREQADKHQQQTGQQAPGQSAFDLGSVRLQPGMTPQDVMKIAAAQAKGTQDGQQQQQPTGQPATGATEQVPEPTGQLPGAVVDGQGSAPTNGTNVGGGSQTSVPAGTRGTAGAAGEPAGQPAAVGTEAAPQGRPAEPVTASAEKPAQVELSKSAPAGMRTLTVPAKGVQAVTRRLPNGVHTVFANANATGLLLGVFGYPSGTNAGGMTLTRSQIEQLQQATANIVAAKTTPKKAKWEINNFLGQIEAAHNKNLESGKADGVPVVVADHLATLGSVKRIAYHEIQHLFAGKYPVDPRDLEARAEKDLPTVAALNKAKNGLMELGYDPDEAWYEIPAHLMAGQRESLGLSEGESAALLRVYLLEVAARHGDTAAMEIFQHGAVQARLVAKAGITDTENASGQPEQPAAQRAGPSRQRADRGSDGPVRGSPSAERQPADGDTHQAVSPPRERQALDSDEPPVSPHAIEDLTPEQASNVEANLQKVLTDPHVQAPAQDVLAELKARRLAQEKRQGMLPGAASVSTGLSTAQRKFLADALRQAMPSLPEKAETAPTSSSGSYRTLQTPSSITIAVPGDGKFLVGGQEQARNLLKALGEKLDGEISGKPLHEKYFSLGSGTEAERTSYVYGAYQGHPMAGTVHQFFFDEPALAESVKAAGGRLAEDKKTTAIVKGITGAKPLTPDFLYKGGHDVVAMSAPDGTHYSVDKKLLDRVYERGYTLQGGSEPTKPLLAVDDKGEIRGLTMPRRETREQLSYGDQIPYKIPAIKKELVAMRQPVAPKYTPEQFQADKMAARDEALSAARNAAEAGDVDGVNKALAKASTFEDVSDAQKAAIRKTLEKASAESAGTATSALPDIREAILEAVKRYPTPPVSVFKRMAKVGASAPREKAVLDEVAQMERVGLIERVPGESMGDPRYQSVKSPGVQSDSQPRPKVQESRAFTDAEEARPAFTVDSKANPSDKASNPSDSGEYPPGSTLNAGIDPGLGKLYREDITPAMQASLGTLAKMQDAVFRLLSPASIDSAGVAARSFREHSAAQAQQDEIAHNELRAFGKLLRKMDRNKRLAFYNTIETGGKQPTPDLQAFADMMRRLLDDARDEVRALGTGKLQQFLTDYMPHYYKDLGKAKEYYAKHYGQRGINASASFLKQRTYDTLADAMAAGLEPLSDDPIELVMTKVKEMHRYVMAQRVLQDIKTDPSLSKYVGAVDGHPPGTWEPLSGTEVWKGSQIEVKEAFDKLVMEKLNEIFKSLQINHTRKQTLSGGTAWGQAQGKSTIRSKFGGPESVLVHELGHIVDTRYKAWEYLTQPNLRVSGVQGARKKIGQELKDLADLRYEGQPVPGPAYRQYVRERGEKVANAIMAMIYAPEKMQQVAPTVKLRLERLLRQHAELSPILDIKPSLVLGERSQGLEVGGKILAGQYYAPPEVARIYNNYLSPGLNGNNIFYDALRFVGNAMNQAQLGLSGFHFMFTLNDAMLSQLAVGIQRLGVGAENVVRGGATFNKAQVATGVKQMALAPFDMLKAPFAGAIYASIGAKFQREYYHPGSQGAEMAAIVDAAIAGGARVRMDSHYKNDAVSAMWKSLRTAGERFAGGNPIGGALHGTAALARAPFALVEATAKPLMEKWVPLMKTGAVTTLLQQMIDDLPPGANISRDDLRKMAAKAVDAVDDRMGQLHYDNLFWNKVFKDLLMGSVRSVGWNVGSLRVIGGAGYDVLSTPKRLLSSRGAGGGGQPPPGGKLPPGGPGGAGQGAGSGGFGYEPVMTQRIAYLIALLFGAGLMGALYQFLHTGKAPHDLKDLYFPRTGKVSESGKPERVQMATYMKDVHGYTTQPVQTLANKLHPVLATAYDAMQNKDYFGTQIRNPDDLKVKQAEDVAKYALTQFEPFSYTNATKNDTKLLSERGVENFFGITPAPKDIDFTAAEKMMLDFLHESGSDTRTQAQALRAKLRAKLIKEGRSGADMVPELRAAMRSGTLTLAQARSVIHASRETWQVEKFKNLSADQALKVFNAGTPAEKRMFAPYLKHKVRGQTPQFRSRAIDALKAMVR